MKKTSIQFANTTFTGILLITEDTLSGALQIRWEVCYFYLYSNGYLAVTGLRQRSDVETGDGGPTQGIGCHSLCRGQQYGRYHPYG